jgi:hypothetical protein
VITNTSSTDLNIGTRILFLPAPPKCQRPPRPEVVRRGLRLAADPNYPSPADIERMTKEVVDEILRGLPDSDRDLRD